MSQVSVIIVSWNARDLLGDCLRSICRPRDAIIKEVIVVDNGSADGSPEMVEELFPEVTLILSQENLGFARANNLGMAQASGQFFAFINSDVVVHQGCLQRLAGFLTSRTDVGLVGPKLVNGEGQLQPSCRRLPTVWNTICRTLAVDNVFPSWHLFAGREMRDWSHDSCAEVEVLSGCFWLARREAVESVGPLDERFFFYAEDVDWCKRFHDKGWKIVFVPEATSTHFGGGSSAIRPLKYDIELLRANLAYWRKHFGRVGEVIFYFLAIIHHAVRLAARKITGILNRQPTTEMVLKHEENSVCLRWLLTGSEKLQP